MHFEHFLYDIDIDRFSNQLEVSDVSVKSDPVSFLHDIIASSKQSDENFVGLLLRSDVCNSECFNAKEERVVFLSPISFMRIKVYNLLETISVHASTLL